MDEHRLQALEILGLEYPDVAILVSEYRHLQWAPRDGGGPYAQALGAAVGALRDLTTAIRGAALGVTAEPQTPLARVCRELLQTDQYQAAAAALGAIDALGRGMRAAAGQADTEHTFDAPPGPQA